MGGGVAVACLAAFVAWRVLLPHDGGLGVGALPAVSPRPAIRAVPPPLPASDAARRALEATTAPSGLQVALGDTMDHVKSLYHITTEPFTSGKSLGFRLPLSGIYFFFNESDKKLENIRVDAPFEGSVEGVRIGDPVSGILSRLGEPYATPWDFGDNKAYAYRVGGRVVRFDIDKAGKVATIFQFTSK